MKKSFALQSLAMMALFSSSDISFERKENSKKTIKKRDFKPIIPSCLKEYWFDCFGNFVHETPSQYSFKCFALNDKNAIRKFNKFIDSYSVPTA